MAIKRKIILEPPRKRFLKRRGNDEDKNILDEERKKRWAEEALRERRKRFEQYYNSESQIERNIHQQDKIHDLSAPVENNARGHEYLVNIMENEVEEYEAFLDDIIENAYNYPHSKKRKERPDESSCQSEKENNVPSTMQIRKQPSSKEHRSVLVDFNGSNASSLRFTPFYKESHVNSIAKNIDFGEQSKETQASTSVLTEKYQRHQVFESSFDPTLLNITRNESTLIITTKDIHQNDVICCGGGGSFSFHPGNVYFQKLVKERLQKYFNSRKSEKNGIAAEIVDLVRKLDPPGRFLKKQEKTGCYIDIGDDKANEKTRQALREENYVKSLAKNASNRKNQHSIVLPDTLTLPNRISTNPNIDFGEQTPAMDTIRIIARRNDESEKYITQSQTIHHSSIVSEDQTRQLSASRTSESKIPNILRNENDSKIVYPNSTQIAKEDIHKHDVLCGRGGSTIFHSGNKYFQKLVKERKQRYLNSRKLEKRSVATEIINIIHKLDPPGRFLKRHDETGCYIEISNSKANEKARQALRENAPSLRSQMDHETRTREFVRNQTELETRTRELGFGREKDIVSIPPT